jgi:tetratricopeptide (TPR) repeat protein
MKSLFIRLSLLLCIVPMLVPARVSAKNSRSSVLVVYDTGDAYALSCFQQIIVTLEYNRVPYTTYDLSSTTSLPPLDGFLSVVTATEMLWKLDPAACGDLKRYVQNGGGLAVFYRGWNQNLHELLGIQNATAPRVTEQKGKGLHFIKEFIPGIDDTRISEKILADISAYDIRTLPSVSVFATTTVDALPAAWVNRYGAGKVIYWNCTILSEKIYRGFIIPSLGAVQPMTFSLILNLGVICLDDFPNASPNVKLEPIKSEFNMTVSEFYAFRWYPDMLKLARQYGLHYTSALIFGYSETTQPPYTFTEWVRSAIIRGGKQVNSSVWLAREAQKDIEVGFHGQNHQPLTLNNWKTVDNMKLSLTASQRRWQFDNLGPAPLSYIPPMNVIDSAGMRALTDIFPTIRVIGSQYMGKYELGQNREFGTDPWNPRLQSIPRITSGFIYDDFNKLLTLSELHTVGAWTHFVHPDDIIPTSGRYAENTRDDLSPENNLWLGEPRKTGFYYQFEKWIAFVKQYYPWLRFRDYAHSYDIVKTFESSTVVVKAEKRLLSIRFNAVPNYCVVHLDEKNAVLSCSGGVILQTNRLAYSSYYVIRANSNDMVLTLRDSLPTTLYRAGSPKHLYLAGNSRYSPSAARRTQYPKGLAALSAVHTSASKNLTSPTSTNAPIPKSLASQPGKKTTANKSRALPPAKIVSPLKIHTEVPQTDKSPVNDIAGNRTPDTVRTLEHTPDTRPTDTPSRSDLIALYRANGDITNAILQCEELLRSEPHNMSVMKQLGEMYLWQERQKEAIGIYERIVTDEPDSLSARIMLARLYSWNQRPHDASAEGRRILRRDPANIDALRFIAAGDRADDNWFDARAWYTKILAHQPADTDAREYLAAVRRDHGLLFTSTYEWIDDSNDLTREQLPVSIELLQTHGADYFLALRREYVRDNRARLSALGYGAGLGSRFALGKKTSLTLEAVATRYDSNWVPITTKARLDHTFGERLSLAVIAERSETVEGIQAIRNRIYTTSARGEMFFQAAERWSISGLAEFESYSNSNLRSTGELLTAYKIVLRQPQITVQASSIYQDTKYIYPSSEPYWTPSRLFTNTVGMTIGYTFFGWFTPEVTEAGTNQGGVLSNNFGAKATVQLSPFLQLIVDYGQVGSSVYHQNVARASLNFRY